MPRCRAPVITIMLKNPAARRLGNSGHSRRAAGSATPDLSEMRVLCRNHFLCHVASEEDADAIAILKEIEAAPSLSAPPSPAKLLRSGLTTRT